MTQNSGRKLAAASGLWAVAFVMGVVYLFVWRTERELGVWTILVALVAQCVTHSLLLDSHRLKVQQHLALLEAERITSGMRSVR